MNYKKLALYSIIAIFIVPMIAGVAAAQNQVPVYTTNVQVPYNVYDGQIFYVYVNNTAGFTNYSVSIYFSGENLTGFTPTDTYNDFQASNGNFIARLSAPDTAQKLVMTIVTFAQYGSTQVTSKNTYVINVVNPIILHASITNTKAVPIYNTTVNFYVDNVYEGNKTISEIAPGQTIMLNYTWVNPYLSKGEHTLKVQVANSFLTVNGQQSVAASNFYYGSVPNYNWIFYIVGAVAIFMIFMVLSAGRRPRAGMRQPKWRKK